MRELEHRQKIRRRIYSLPGVLFIGVLSLFLAKGGYSLYLKEQDSVREKDALIAKVESLKKHEGELKASMAKLGTDAGLEEEFKAKFNVAKVGERVAIIVEPSNNESTTTENGRPWYSRLWDAIIGR